MPYVAGCTALLPWLIPCNLHTVMRSVGCLMHGAA